MLTPEVCEWRNTQINEWIHCWILEWIGQYWLTDWLIGYVDERLTDWLIRYVDERSQTVFGRTSELGLKSPAEYIMQNSSSLNYKTELALR